MTDDQAITETCLGPPFETIYFQHTTDTALAHHLASFLGHRSADYLIRRAGIANINTALTELPTDGSLSNPAGWLSWRAMRLKAGHPPLPSDQEIAREITRSARRQKFLDDYHSAHSIPTPQEDNQ